MIPLKEFSEDQYRLVNENKKRIETTIFETVVEQTN